MPDKMTKPRIAVFAGPTATVLNTPALVTGQKARVRHGLDLRVDEFGVATTDELRPQRLVRPVTVYVEQFSAHPLEHAAKHLYGPPDGFVDRRTGDFSRDADDVDGIPVYEVELRPEDGLYALPYAARTAEGKAWEGDCLEEEEVEGKCRQPFLPDASRLFEEIDRFGLNAEGHGGLLSARATYDFFGLYPSGGLPNACNQDTPSGSVYPHEGFFPYRPRALRRNPPARAMADIVNRISEVLDNNTYLGGLWLEGSTSIEETAYWLNLLLGVDHPIVCVASQFPHGVLGNNGDRNVVDAIEYLTSRVWEGQPDRDDVGVVIVSDRQVITAREAEKKDARPGGFAAAGGHGGIIGSTGVPGRPVLSFKPSRRHTWNSEVNVRSLPPEVDGLRGKVRIKDSADRLLPSSIPLVPIVKHYRYGSGDTDEIPLEAELIGAAMKRANGLIGFIAEGETPFGHMEPALQAELTKAVLGGCPVVLCGRGSVGGFVPTYEDSLFISGSNLTSIKARLLLIASMMKLGSLPRAEKVDAPSAREMRDTLRRIEAYQEIFDSH